MGEFARYSRHPAVPELGRLHARFVRHEFGRHTHETYAVGVLESGREELSYGREVEYAGAGAVVLINPEVVHTGRPAAEHGWGYRALYPSKSLVRSVLGVAPAFTSRIVHDPELARLLLAAFPAGEGTLALALRRLFAAHGTLRAEPMAGHGLAAAVRELLLDQYQRPPGLSELAARFGTSQYKLLRAFQHEYGLPPHAYLTQHRIRRARGLIERGAELTDVAVTVGFVDQAHLSRHFRRLVGVTPGAYRRAMQERTRSRSGPGRSFAG
ncbi:AraC family transcriptional regulator [Amycolatopsis nigrescens]|uniref:AraC family transcriptional regulator n=1 Tax=Amycolatopsis nigrescens TaxID=381445 RepID=UPI00036CB6CC|nr:AraC family transcriptional regulator [Amycolatopsis nigrescens]